jgi:hypothetical protein
VADQPGRHGQPVRLGRGVHIAQQRAAAGPDPPGRRVDRDRVEQAQVDHQPVIAHGRAGRVVCTATHGYLQPVLAAESDRGGHVRS